MEYFKYIEHIGGKHHYIIEIKAKLYSLYLGYGNERRPLFKLFTARQVKRHLEMYATKYTNSTDSGYIVINYLDGKNWRTYVPFIWKDE